MKGRDPRSSLLSKEAFQVVAARIEVVAEKPRPESDLETPFRAQPNSVEETGIDYGQLLDLCIKTIYYGGRPNARAISARMAMPFPIVETQLTFLKKEQFIEVVGSSGIEQRISTRSRPAPEENVEALERNQYVGPRPCHSNNTRSCAEQSVGKIRVDANVVDSAPSDLVLSDDPELGRPGGNSPLDPVVYDQKR
jgi:hypothetical protein